MRDPCVKRVMWGVDTGSVREMGDVGGWTRDPFVKRVTWGGGCGIRSGNG
jgi:hypothetical protein